jgi:hypothetical protein
MFSVVSYALFFVPNGYCHRKKDIVGSELTVAAGCTYTLPLSYMVPSVFVSLYYKYVMILAALYSILSPLL